jgi:hypothetical protein
MVSQTTEDCFSSFSTNPITVDTNQIITNASEFLDVSTKTWVVDYQYNNTITG